VSRTTVRLNILKPLDITRYFSFQIPLNFIAFNLILDGISIFHRNLRVVRATVVDSISPSILIANQLTAITMRGQNLHVVDDVTIENIVGDTLRQSETVLVFQISIHPGKFKPGDIGFLDKVGMKMGHASDRAFEPPKVTPKPPAPAPKAPLKHDTLDDLEDDIPEDEDQPEDEESLIPTKTHFLQLLVLHWTQNKS
jgi:hypothetical protein